MRRRLALMMGLVYSVQGAFWPILAIHLADLGMSERGRSWVFGTMAVGSFAMPLGVGQLVDRFIPAQFYLAGAYALGCVILGLIGAGVARTAPAFFVGFLAYWLVMAPCYSLSNALAFRHLAHPDRDFGQVRLWGTVGWMVAGWAVSLLMTGGDPTRGMGRGIPEAFGVAAVCSLVAAGYCLTLPHTPPVRLTPGGRRSTTRQDVASLLWEPGVAVYLLASFGVSVATPFVYQIMPEHLRRVGMDPAWVSSAMSLGQWPEVVALAILPILINRLGYRVTLCVGVGAYVLRFGSLALVPGLFVATAGIPLHGVGVACFSIVGQMFLNSHAAADRRASTQALNTVVNGGFGSIAGSLLAGETLGWFRDEPERVFLVPMSIHLALVMLLILGFRPAKLEPLAPIVLPATPGRNE